MTVNAAGRVSRRPEQLTVMSYEPGLASCLMVAVPLDVSLAPLTGVRWVVRKASEVMVPPWGQPSTVTVIWPPRAITLGSATMLLGWLWSPPAVAVGAASPRTATAAPAAARARVLRM